MPKESLSASSVWTQRSLGIDLPQSLDDISPNSIGYICDKIYPFFQILNSEATFIVETKINFITATSGWIIHDYGEAISTAPPDNSSTANSITKQIATVSAVANLIATKGWSKIELIAGTPTMQRLLWIESKRYGFELQGYAPNENDEKCLQRLMKHTKDNGLTWEKHAPEKPKNELIISGAS